MRYGIPYQGSKNKIAKELIDLFPAAEHFYDLFAGGCAVSHCALLSGKWKKVHISDMTDSVLLFRDCLQGNLPDGSEWISRDEFYARKDSDPYVRLLWSFGNNQRDYIYSREIEPYRKAVHEMIYAPTPGERRLKFCAVCRMLPFYLAGGERRAMNHESMERCQRLLTDFNPTNVTCSSHRKMPERFYHLQHESARNYIESSIKALGGGNVAPFAEGSMR